MMGVFSIRLMSMSFFLFCHLINDFPIELLLGIPYFCYITLIKLFTLGFRNTCQINNSVSNRNQ